MNDNLNIKKNEFRVLTEEQQLAKLTTPVYVPLTQNPDDETFPQKLERYKKFEKLPEKVKYKLVDFGTSQKNQAIGRKYNFNVLRLANITRLIREYYFGEVRLEDFPREIERRMGASLLTAQEIARYIKQEIIDWDPWTEYLEKLPKASAREILVRFPKVAEQEITNGYLEFKNQPDEIFDPTIRNWLRDYVQHLGQERHSNVERMDFLFHSENTKNLSSTEREKLGIILKSFDENTPLAIDTENNEIVFDISEKPAVPEKPFPPSGVMAERPMVNNQRPISTKTQSFVQSSAFPSRELSSRDSSKPSFIQPQKPSPESFIRPYPPISRSAGNVAGGSTTVAKPQTPPRPIDQSSTFPLRADARNSSKSDFEFTNPYPAPGTHRIKETESEMAGGAPVKLKGFSEGVPRDTQGSAFPALSKARLFPSPTSREIPQSQALKPANSSRPNLMPPKPYAPSRPKNIIYPHYGPGKEGKPEPKIEGNIVDLSGQ